MEHADASQGLEPTDMTTKNPPGNQSPGYSGTVESLYRLNNYKPRIAQRAGRFVIDGNKVVFAGP